jgi:hypothetical protein
MKCVACGEEIKGALYNFPDGAQCVRCGDGREIDVDMFRRMEAMRYLRRKGLCPPPDEKVIVFEREELISALVEFKHGSNNLKN